MGQPYINPNYFAQYPQYFQPQPQTNPYMQRMEQLQQYQQSLQQPLPPTQMSGANQMSTLGKMVDSIDVVKATDIPMDGNMYYFPKADGTEIFSKQWLANGQTRILTFKPVLEDNHNNVSYDTERLKIGLSDEVTEVFMKRFDELEKRIDDLAQKKTVTKAKKESEEE